MVDLASNETLSAQVMQMILHKLFGADPSVLVIDPSNMVDLEKGRVHVYDSMASSYMIGVRAVAQQMIMMLPGGVRPSARLVTHDHKLGVQYDSYNCGVYVLLAFEMFSGSEPLGHLDKKTLQCMRYRYFRICA
ncbi:hypothetical protein PInf_002379 [Phytophthora infestans]|nr:hypothetical protein PInf_002379 [Phytophthora infestans]